jgi:hypothetical protein
MGWSADYTYNIVRLPSPSAFPFIYLFISALGSYGNITIFNNKFSDRIELVIVAFVILGLVASRYD